MTIVYQRNSTFMVIGIRIPSDKMYHRKFTDEVADGKENSVI